jgi:Ca2+-binding EF-hand superfamily protein
MNDKNLPKAIEEQARKTFHKYDLDKSNYIDLHELKVLMLDVSKEIGIPEPSEEDLKQVLIDTDKNKDNKLQLEEFLELFKIIYIMKNMDDK